MDILERVALQIIDVEEKVDLVNSKLASDHVHPADMKTINSLLREHRGYIAERTKLTGLLHTVIQDTTLGNEEARARINKLLGTGSDLEDLSDVFSDIYGD